MSMRTDRNVKPEQGGSPMARRMGRKPAALLIAALLLLPLASLRAQEDSDVIRLGVERRSVARVRVKMLPLELVEGSAATRELAVKMASRLVRDLYYSGLVDIALPLPQGVASPYPRGRAPEPPDEYTLPEYGISLRLEGGEQGPIVCIARLLEPGGELNFGLRYNVDPERYERSVHHFADEVVMSLTGEQGISQTRILFSRGQGDQRELYVVDFDGENLRQVTRNGSLNLMPRWSPDSRRVAYTSYRNGRQRLLLLEAGSGKSRPVGDFPGLNVGAAWAPSGDELVVTLSRDENSEIYRLGPDGTIIQRLTFESAIDCSPAWDPSGRQIVYTSDRTGSPQIYVMDREGANRRRITWEGSYNDSAVWSPRSDRIAYVSRAEGLFTIFVLEPDGSNLQRVTFAHDRDNEDPSWAPDGRHLVVSSNRSGYTNLWVLDVDSGEARQLTQGAGADTGPSWSGPPASAGGGADTSN